MVKNGKRGFTLIELLVVIAIIGMLAAVILASLGTARSKARDARRVSDIGQIQTALELYFDKNQSYATQAAWNTAAPGDVGTALKNAGYLPQVPTDPTTGAAYFYMAYTDNTHTTACTTSGCLSYHLGANLENNGSTALSNDKDMDDSAHSGFIGGDTGTCVGSAPQLTTGYCFDVTP